MAKAGAVLMLIFVGLFLAANLSANRAQMRPSLERVR